MTECEKKVLKGLISEYELKVKYNNDTRDYEIYSMLLDVQKENEELQKTNSLLFEQEKEKIRIIQKMINCYNCKHRIRPETKESIRFCIECKQLDEQKENIILTKWELEE